MQKCRRRGKKERKKKNLTPISGTVCSYKASDGAILAAGQSREISKAFTTPITFQRRAISRIITIIMHNYCLWTNE